MNQILLQVLSRDPLKTPGICLSFRWLLPLIPHFGTIGGWFIFPLLGTWLGYIFLDMDDLWNQVFSLTGILYISILVGMIPKPNISSKLWFDANLFTITYYLLYFAELGLIAHLNLDLEYSIGWLFSITFSTFFIFLFYAILLRCGLSTLHYFKTIVSIYLLTDLGNILALGLLSPFYSYKIFVFMSSLLLIYLLLPYRHPLMFSWLTVSPAQLDKNLPMLRCLLWGALSVWADYISLTPFYVLEMILASKNHQKKVPRLHDDRGFWNTHKEKFWMTMNANSGLELFKNKGLPSSRARSAGRSRGKGRNLPSEKKSDQFESSLIFASFLLWLLDRHARRARDDNRSFVDC